MSDPTPSAAGQSCATPSAKISRFRPWVQSVFSGLWLVPLGSWLHGIPSCVFHCYACPLSSMACPVGLAAQYAANFPVWGTIPLLLIGVLLVAGASVGSLVCGWACPFGYLQDLIAKLTRTKWLIPSWTGYLRYAVLFGMVLFLPWYWGRQGTTYEDQAISFCRLCPAGALEAGVWYSLSSLLNGQGWIMSWYKSVILILFITAALMIHRPWCRVLCPLGGFLAFFNRFSLFHLRFNPKQCVECNTCRARCDFGVKVDQKVNVTGCVRCLECTTCGSLEPAFALPGKRTKAGATSAS
jgi:ferredoxin-type protein NapH